MKSVIAEMKMLKQVLFVVEYRIRLVFGIEGGSVLCVLYKQFSRLEALLASRLLV